MIRLIIADDIQILRQGLKAILSQDPELSVVGLAANGKEAWELCAAHRPDLVLMDMRMPDYDGSWGIRKIKEDYPDIRVLVLTTFDDPETVDAAVRSGADGYILKEMEDDRVIQAVKAVSAGINVFGGTVFAGMRTKLRSPAGETPPAPGPANAADPAVQSLTPRERDIMKCIAQGMDNREISETLYLAEGTVRNHISRVLDKLHLKDRTQLAVYTVKHGLDE